MLKILAISDLHGKVPDIGDAVNDVDLIVSVGDFCSAHKIRALEFRYWSDKRHWSKIIGQKKARKLVRQDMVSGKKVLSQLNKIGKTVLIVPGNVDYPDCVGFVKEKTYQYEEYLKRFDNVLDVEFSLADIGEYQVIGYGRSSFPERLGDKKARREIVKTLSSLFKKAKKPVIFLSHNVPYNVLDKVAMKSSPAFGQHIGSDITREIIERFSPLLCICGHMHESQGVKKVGRTTVVNDGWGMIGQYALITLDKKRIDVTLKRTH